MKILPRAISVSVFVGLMLVSIGASGQSNPSSQRELTDEQRKGHAFFMQRCAFCHVPRTIKAGADFKPPSGPILAGLLVNATAEKEATVHQIISKGIEGRMPGYVYSLAPDEIEAVIEYMKTLE